MQNNKCISVQKSRQVQMIPIIVHNKKTKIQLEVKWNYIYM